ncbi:hypothetical protein ACH5RR_037571 [Cinchona calisaya]|uniref:Uncharacterized protein n=1 Tax=Cinchona calisaya TaxID=153742 RepID=A0ABD2Y9N3_9GENT
MILQYSHSIYLPLQPKKKKKKSQMTSRNFPFSLCLSSLLLTIHFFFVTKTLAQVPANETFKIINEGEFGEYITEYDAGYRVIRNEVYDFFAFPFRLCFYNTTPGSFVLGMRAGIPRDEDLMRWVWDANRNRPVKENATLTFGKDGNLVLADVDGSVAWQTNTANKGVTGIQMLPNGNLVLYDKKGKFIWQSFDYPVDTLLAGMSVKQNNKLVSRTSDVDGRDGKYSLVLENSGFNLYINNSGQLVNYNGWSGSGGSFIRFYTAPIDQDPKSAGWELLLETFHDKKSSPSPKPSPSRRSLLQSFPVGSGNALILRKLNYNASISFLRLESDGNVKVFTYFDGVPYLKWSETFAFFSSYYVRECGLPSKCGSFGLCQRGMCVGCPSPSGLLGWTENCQPPKLKPCVERAKVDYYKIDSAEHFLNRESTGNGQGPIKIEACKEKCSKDCRCKGFVYKEDTKKCLLVPVLGTFIRNVNTSTAYIKYNSL